LVAEGVYAPIWCCACEGRQSAPPQFGLIDQDAAESAFGE
jgi:hypothetical protein